MKKGILPVFLLSILIVGSCQYDNNRTKSSTETLQQVPTNDGVYKLKDGNVEMQITITGATFHGVIKEDSGWGWESLNIKLSGKVEDNKLYHADVDSHFVAYSEIGSVNGSYVTIYMSGESFDLRKQ